MVTNSYLISNLDDFMELSDVVKKCRSRIISELVHSSFFIAQDENHMLITISLDNRKYAFIFTDDDEFKKAFPADESSSRVFEFTTLKNILNAFKLDGYILNVSSQNMYITKKFINALKDLPSDITDHSDAYSSQELKSLRITTDNGDVEEFIRNHGNCMELFQTVSYNPLFALIESDNDMGILECDGMIDTFGLESKHDFHSHEGYVCMFTSEKHMGDIETSKFSYLALVDLATAAHYAIKHESRGIILNPGIDNYIIPVETLLEYWPLINRTCHNDKLVTAKHIFFVID